jgi:hypothetical protein
VPNPFHLCQRYPPPYISRAGAVALWHRSAQVGTGLAQVLSTFEKPFSYNNLNNLEQVGTGFLFIITYVRKKNI